VPTMGAQEKSALCPGGRSSGYTNPNPLACGSAESLVTVGPRSGWATAPYYALLKLLLFRLRKSDTVFTQTLPLYIQKFK